MEKKEKVIQAIYSAIDQVNQLLPKEMRLDKSPETTIIDGTGKLDSLGIVNLIVATETKIVEEFGVTINLADEKVMSEDDSPLRTVETLTNYINLLLSEDKNV